MSKYVIEMTMSSSSSRFEPRTETVASTDDSMWAREIWHHLSKAQRGGYMDVRRVWRVIDTETGKQYLP